MRRVLGLGMGEVIRLLGGCGPQPWFAGCSQCAGAPVQTRKAQPGVGERHHLRSHAQRLVLPGRDAGPVLSKGGALGGWLDGGTNLLL